MQNLDVIGLETISGPFAEVAKRSANRNIDLNKRQGGNITKR
jgi:hypothetical protein